MIVPNSPASLKLAMNAASARKLYNTLAVVGYMMGIVAPGTQWRQSLMELIDSCPLAEEAAMGFPPNWRDLSAWKSPTI
jgi:hypothetical protein